MKSKQWVIKRIVHQFRRLTFINQNASLISAIYENKFHSVDKESFKAWENISFTTPQFLGVEKAIVMGCENTFLQIICSRTQNKSRVAFMRSELRRNKDLFTSFVPQNNQIVIISFEAQQLTEGIILGGLFKTNQSRPFDMDKKDFTLESSGSLNQKVQHNLIAKIGGEKIINVTQSMCCQCEHYCMDAKAIIRQVGSASLELNQKGISIKGKKILLN